MPVEQEQPKQEGQEGPGEQKGQETQEKSRKKAGERDAE